MKLQEKIATGKTRVIKSTKIIDKMTIKKGELLILRPMSLVLYNSYFDGRDNLPDNWADNYLLVMTLSIRYIREYTKIWEDGGKVNPPLLILDWVNARVLADKLSGKI